jgi:hypothetical protein
VIQVFRLIRALVILGWLAGGSIAHGIEFKRASTHQVSAGETIESELWLQAGASDFQGTARDDLFILAYSNTVSGTVEKDVWLAGQHVGLGGVIGDDARLAGIQVRLDGVVNGDLLAFGAQTLQLSSQSVVRGAARLSGGHVLVSGVHHGPLWILSQRVTLDGEFNGPLRVIADDIVILKDTRIAGDLVYSSPRELFLNEGVFLGGKLVRRELTGGAVQISWSTYLWIQLFLYLAALTTGLPLIGLFPRFTGQAVRTIRHAGLRSLLAGTATVLLLPVVAYLALWTLIGVPLSLLLLMGLAALVYLSKVYVALALGSFLLRRRGAHSFGMTFLVYSLGLLFLYILNLPPIVGSVIWLLTVLVGAGGMVLSLRRGEAPIVALPDRRETPD